MKLHITPTQLNELSPAAKERLRAWWNPQFGDAVYAEVGWWRENGDKGTDWRVVYVGDFPIGDRYGAYQIGAGDGYGNDDVKMETASLLPNIGQMIQLLDEYRDSDLANIERHKSSVHGIDNGWSIIFVMNNVTYRGYELCDALWAACKEVLENEATSVQTSGPSSERTDERTNGGSTG